MILGDVVEEREKEATRNFPSRSNGYCDDVGVLLLLVALNTWTICGN